MTANNAPTIATDSVGGAAEICHLTTAVNQVVIINTHASQTITARIFSGNTSAEAVALATATPAVIGADENFLVPAGAAASGGTNRKVLWKSRRAKFVAISLIASGASTTYTVEGTTFFTD
jgi:hypothetical protein